VRARCHRVDMKNAAFVKMRDSVSFCKQTLVSLTKETQAQVIAQETFAKRPRDPIERGPCSQYDERARMSSSGYEECGICKNARLGQFL